KSSSNANSQSNNSSSNSNINSLSPTLTSTSTGGSSKATSSNNSSGNTSTYQSDTNVAASKIPVATALGIAPPPTVNCAAGFGVGAQTMAFGISGSGAKID